MTDSELLQIDPPQLTFSFEPKKQCSCRVRLSNNASHYVAFKVKTTSPQKYCVRPTIGLINPHGTCDFAVTMQAQRTPPPDFHCKDKFLILSTVVPPATSPDQLSSDLFSKESGKYVEEKKLRVVLVSPPSLPKPFLPANGDLSQDSRDQEKDRVVITGAENIPPTATVPEEIGLETARDMEEKEEEGKARTDVDIVSNRVENMSNSKLEKDAVLLNLAKDYEQLKSRLSIMDSKLLEAEGTIRKLSEEKRANTREKELLKLELEVLKRKSNRKKTQVGFPLLFVCVVALVSVAVGYYIHP